ncbi:hypothetical protein EIN_371740 [Entamoeba invadens IP1]|uniref:Serine aminopeptidase S33 domain-containing protein n=1 Tax=Entamoeba invadens IP1 TaxID=370355 RepID=A0A0A1UGK7_ENTIV|nr:hypothetical protein EIN_371740 [Entamoeba invadens IP1]ELP92762.1 hypothetical protein EIN_371740 [Entamoeba invadens IP1]|eukprot:XP_004259533.1 hypothetical protein EIN_371740 [Entamoeba invadens IP1]
MSIPTQPITLKQGAKIRKLSFSTGVQPIITGLTKIDTKNIPILHIKPKSTVTEPYTILYNHDANECLSDIKSWLSCLAEIFKANVVAWEYPGYTVGSSYSDTKTASNIETVWRFVTKTLKQSPSRVILYGKGAGVGPTLCLAYKIQKHSKGLDKLAGIVLINPQVEKGSLCFSCVTIPQVKKITAPVMFISSTCAENKDDLVNLSACFQFKRGIHFLKSETTDLEDEKLDDLCYRLNKFIVTLFPEYKDVFSGAELEKRKPAEIYTDPIEAIRAFMKKEGIEEVTDKLVQFGYLNINDIVYIEQFDIESFGFSKDISDKLWDVVQRKKKEKASQGTTPITEKRKSLQTAEVQPDIKSLNSEDTIVDMFEISVESCDASVDLSKSDECLTQKVKVKNRVQTRKEKYRLSLPNDEELTKSLLQLKKEENEDEESKMKISESLRDSCTLETSEEKRRSAGMDHPIKSNLIEIKSSKQHRKTVLFGKDFNFMEEAKKLEQAEEEKQEEQKQLYKKQTSISRNTFSSLGMVRPNLSRRQRIADNETKLLTMKMETEEYSGEK